MKTEVVDLKTISRKWYVIDANGQILGRLASKVASILMGKGKVAYSPNQDHGDYVVIINAKNVHLTGKKADTKVYFRHSTYPGGGKYRSFKEQKTADSAKIIRDAVHGMLPKTTLGRKIISKLHIYAQDNHPHVAQKPELVTI